MKFITTTIAVLVTSVILTGCLNSSNYVGSGNTSGDIPNLSDQTGSEYPGLVPSPPDTNVGVNPPVMPETVVDQPAMPSTIFEELQSRNEFTTLVSALQATGLSSTLTQEGPRTLFAPNNRAFELLGSGAVDELLATPDVLREILLYHVLSDKYLDAATATILSGSEISTANGATIALCFNDTVTINESNVVEADIAASNGVIHALDTVLTPPSKTSSVYDALVANGLTTFATVVEQGGLVETLSNPNQQFTVFAPSNEAFEDMGDFDFILLMNDDTAKNNLVRRHAIRGAMIDSGSALSLAGQRLSTLDPRQTLKFRDRSDGLYVEDSKIVITDIYTDNGIIHIIDEVVSFSWE